MTALAQQALAESEAPEAVKMQAITLAATIAGNIAYQNTRGNANAFGDGSFMELFMKLFELLLPILLKMLFPTS